MEVKMDSSGSNLQHGHDKVKEVEITKDASNCSHIIIHMDMKVYGTNVGLESKGEICYSNAAQDECLEKEQNGTILNMLNKDENEFSGILQNNCNYKNNQTKNEMCKSEAEVTLLSVEYCESVGGINHVQLDNSENIGRKRYGLRKRKNIFTKEDNFYTYNDIKCSKRKIITKQKDLLKCSKCNSKFEDEIGLHNHQNNQNFGMLCCSNICSKDSCSEEDGEKQFLKCTNCNEILKNNFQSENHLCLQDRISLKCEKCNQIFNNKSKLEVHIRENQCRNSEGFTCDLCKETFYDFFLLKQHIKAHLANPLEDVKCSKNLASKNVLVEYSCGSVEMKQYSCNLCTKVFKKEDKFKIHSLEHHGLNYKCLKCNEFFSSQVFLNKHRVRCSSSLQNCSTCGKIFRNVFQYKKHLRIHKNSFITCKNCRKIFSDELKFNEHLSANECKKSVNRKLKYECDACGRKFSKLVKLQIHILNIHHGVSYDCDKCNRKFPSEEECNAHRSGKDCKAEEPCSCKICGKIFAKRDYLKKHEYIHSNVLYKCKFCYCAFMKEKSYKRHIERMNCSKSARKIRLSEFNYKKCRICDLDFEEEEFLLEHFNARHPGENPHQCFCCESCLPSFKELQNHIHLHNIQKFTCSLCGKPYTSQEGFRKHRLKHKGAEFKCKFCDSEFLNESRFKFHVKTCKKNPESGYHPSEDKPKSNKKDDRPKQSRQLHWESRIIMKHLRGGPDSPNGKQSGTWMGSQNDTFVSSNFFNEPDADSNDSNVRGWFDDYYKTEEDDFAFGLRRDNTLVQTAEPTADVTESGNIGSNNKKDKNLLPSANDASETVNIAFPKNDSTESNEISDSNHETSSSDSSTSDSSEEEFIEDVEFPVEYNPKKCRICMIVFSQEYELLHHFIKVHPDKKAHRCPNCEVECPLFAQLKEHMKTHGIGMGVYNCDNCSKKFKSEKKMKSHNIRCKGLDAEITSTGGADKNYAGFKSDPEDYCKRCCKKFQTKCGYRRHKQLCKEKRKSNRENKKTEDVPGAACEAQTNDHSTNATVTEDVVKPSKSSDKVDEECLLSKSNTAPKAAANSAESNDGKANGKDAYVGEPPLDSFPCRLCDKKFQYERGIVMHFKSSHPGHKPLVCHICNMHLADKLKEHLKTHGIGEEFICELCGKRFNQKFLSKIHEMWHQGIEYKCNNCKQKFLNREKMDKHIAENRCSNRQSLMRLPCDICGKSYRSKFGLSKHYITHTPKELRPVKNRMNCEFCGKWFENNNGLQRHRRIHTGERPFCCRFCSKAFAQEGNCKAHERIHTGESRPRKKKAAPSEVSATYANNLNPCMYGSVSVGPVQQQGVP